MVTSPRASPLVPGGSTETCDALTDAVVAARRISRFRSSLGSGMNEILPRLYLGSLRDATDAEQLTKNNIGYIVSIHDMAARIHPQHELLSVLRIRLADAPSESIHTHFPEAVKFIHNARLAGGSVLVHCLAGVSRSATLVVAYLLTVCDLTFYNAVSFMTARRPAANPNFGFRMQLCKYADQGAIEERVALREHCGRTAFDEQWREDRLATYSKMVTQCGPTYVRHIPGFVRPRSASRDAIDTVRRKQAASTQNSRESAVYGSRINDIDYIDV